MSEEKEVQRILMARIVMGEKCMNRTVICLDVGRPQDEKNRKLTKMAYSVYAWVCLLLASPDFMVSALTRIFFGSF